MQREESIAGVFFVRGSRGTKGGEGIIDTGHGGVVWGGDKMPICEGMWVYFPCFDFGGLYDNPGTRLS